MLWMILWGLFGQLCETSHYLFTLCGILQLMLCHVVIWVLNIEREQVQPQSKSTGEETNTNNMPYPALKCHLSPWTSAVPSRCVLHTHSSQSPSPSTKWCWSAASDASLQYSTCSFKQAGAWDHAVINGQAARDWELYGRVPPRLFCLIASPLTSGRVWLSSAGESHVPVS